MTLLKAFLILVDEKNICKVQSSSSILARASNISFSHFKKHYSEPFNRVFSALVVHKRPQNYKITNDPFENEHTVNIILTSFRDTGVLVVRD